MIIDKSRFPNLSGVTVLLLVLLLTSAGSATPEFAVQYKQSCQLCHHNPTGGGMRALYGAQYFSYMDLPWKPFKNFQELEQIQPKLNDNFQIGVDFRSLYWNDIGETESDPDGNSYLTMQGDLYFAFTPNDNTMIYVEKGLGSHFEAFAQFQGLPATGVIKAGRFVPNYGWRFADHKSFVRDALGFSANPTKGISLIEDNGIEIGFYPMEWEFSLALTNGAPSAIDGDDGKAVTARSAARFSLLDANVTIGGSYRYNQIGLSSPDLRYGGGFWGFNRGRFTYIGETDWILKDDKTKLVATHKVDYRIRQGWDVSYSYDFYDPDLDLKTGIATRKRIASNLYLTGYLELIPAIEFNEENSIKYTTTELQLHVWF